MVMFRLGLKKSSGRSFFGCVQTFYTWDDAMDGSSNKSLNDFLEAPSWELFWAVDIKDEVVDFR